MAVVTSGLAKPKTGLGAIRVGLSHLLIMIRGKYQVFADRPPVVEDALGIDKETLGGHKMHAGW